MKSTRILKSKAHFWFGTNIVKFRADINMSFSHAFICTMQRLYTAGFVYEKAHSFDKIISLNQ